MFYWEVFVVELKKGVCFYCQNFIRSLSPPTFSTIIFLLTALNLLGFFSSLFSLCLGDNKIQALIQAAIQENILLKLFYEHFFHEVTTTGWNMVNNFVIELKKNCFCCNLLSHCGVNIKKLAKSWFSIRRRLDFCWFDFMVCQKSPSHNQAKPYFQRNDK